MSREWRSSLPDGGPAVIASLGALPILDRVVLARFGDEVGDETAFRRFLGSFLSLLPSRIRSLRAAAAIGDHETVLLRAESIGVGAEMTGARRLGHVASEVAELAREGGVLCEERIAALAAEATQTSRELSDFAEPVPA